MSPIRLFLSVCLLLLPATAHSASVLDPAHLWSSWPERRLVAAAAPCLKHAELVEHIENLAQRHGEALAVEELGTSVEGRSITLLTVGQGEKRVLLWSQMHGDEPSATPAVLDLIDLLLSHPEDPAVRTVLDKLTLLVIPMLNPDGAEAYTRHNAQAIDINRDALSLASPEGRILKAVRDRFDPILGFNLHDQNRRRTVGTTRVLASTSVLAVTGDEAQTWTPQRLLAKRASAAIATTLEAFTPGGIGRFDATWSPRAFGDNITAWGTPVVLIESGGPPPGGTMDDLSRLNYVALATVLRDLAQDGLASHNPDLYDQIPENNLGEWVDLKLSGGLVLQPGALPSGPAPSYRADLAIDLLRTDRVAGGCDSRNRIRARIVELGDGSTISGAREVEASGLVVVPALTAGADGWRARQLLNPPRLDQLAKRGVGHVLWQVPASRLAAALDLARTLEGNGRPRLEVTTHELPAGLLELSAALWNPSGSSLADSIAAIAPRQATTLSARTLGEALPQLANAAAGRVTPVLRPGATASFLLLRVAEGKSPESTPLSELEVAGVWIDGHEVTR